jgi:hypothetical protein
MSNYIISLKHTGKNDPAVTFWKPDSIGYSVAIDRAGIYENPEEGYHTDDLNIARPKYMVDPLLKKMSYGDFKNMLMLPNTKKTWRALGHEEMAEWVSAEK